MHAVFLLSIELLLSLSLCSLLLISFFLIVYLTYCISHRFFPSLASFSFSSCLSLSLSLPPTLSISLSLPPSLPLSLSLQSLDAYIGNYIGDIEPFSRHFVMGQSYVGMGELDEAYQCFLAASEGLRNPGTVCSSVKL